jgi:hypothetical protein
MLVAESMPALVPVLAFWRHHSLMKALKNRTIRLASPADLGIIAAFPLAGLLALLVLIWLLPVMRSGTDRGIALGTEELLRAVAES